MSRMNFKLTAHQLKKKNELFIFNKFTNFGNFYNLIYLIHYNYITNISNYKYLFKYMHLFNKYLMWTFKNFFNALYTMVSLKWRFFVFDNNSSQTLLYNYYYNEYDIIKYNNYFYFNYKQIKNQAFFLYYKNFVRTYKIKFIIVLNHYFYLNFLNFFKFLNIYVFGLVPFNSLNCMYDFFLMTYTLKYNVLHSYSFYSTIISIININKNVARINTQHKYINKWNICTKLHNR